MAHVQYSKEVVSVDGQDIEIFKIDHDVNGNPRYVVHFLSLVRGYKMESVTDGYNEAIRKIRTVGGRKYRARWFGGGVVFQSYDVIGDLKHALLA